MRNRRRWRGRCSSGIDSEEDVAPADNEVAGLSGSSHCWRRKQGPRGGSAPCTPLFVLHSRSGPPSSSSSSSAPRVALCSRSPLPPNTSCSAHICTCHHPSSTPVLTSSSSSPSPGATRLDCQPTLGTPRPCTSSCAWRKRGSLPTWLR